MKLKVKDYFFLLIVLLGVVFLVFQKFTGNVKKEIKENNGTEKQVIHLKDIPLLVQIADTEDLRENGLRGIERLEQNEGMLFLHDYPAQHIYNMHNMKIDLDFIFIKDEKVVDIAKSVSFLYNGTIKGGTVYDKVIEINADWAKKNKLKITDSFSFD